MTDSGKVVSLADAVRRFIHDGAHISFGGFTVNRQPMACTYEIIRQGITGLHVYMHSGGQALDPLIGAGCVRAVEIAYGANGRFAPTCVRFRKAVERGELLVEDYTNYQMTLRFQAGAMGVPFLPVRSGMGTDIVKRWGFDAEMRRRDARLPNLKLVESDLLSCSLKPCSFDLIHAALIFEYLAPERAAPKLAGWLTPGGVLAVVLQLPSPESKMVSQTEYTSDNYPFFLCHFFLLLDIEILYDSQVVTLYRYLLPKTNTRMARADRRTLTAPSGEQAPSARVSGKG